MKKFSAEDVSSNNQMKSSAQKAARAKILQTYPRLEKVIDEIIPKKTAIHIAKFTNHISLLITNNEPIFFQIRDGSYLPTLRLLHKYPSMMPKMQVDRGAIVHILKGSNVMCRGLTSKGGRMENVSKDTVVQITAEGKLNAFAVGVTSMSTDEIKEKNQDICIETYHYLNDGLWINHTLT